MAEEEEGRLKGRRKAEETGKDWKRSVLTNGFKTGWCSFGPGGRTSTTWYFACTRGQVSPAQDQGLVLFRAAFPLFSLQIGLQALSV